MDSSYGLMRPFSVIALALICAPSGAFGKVLPEDRADVLWHVYDGGGVTIQGPSVLVRKAYKDKVSVWGNYYVDMISGASIDVVATASEYSEERREISAGVDVLHDKTNLGLGVTQSAESDYEATTVHASVSQDFFSELTTLSIGCAYGDDVVRRNGDDTWSDTATHQSWRIELSQILTKRILMNASWEAVVDSGYLNNPYRSVRFLDSDAELGYRYQQEHYPRTRASDAAAIRAMAYLPWRAAVRGEYRYYSDSWNIAAHTAELSYTHTIGDRIEIDAKARLYSQTQASFYSDLFPYRDAQNFLARDKEMAAFDSTSIGLGVGYTFRQSPTGIVKKGSVNLHVDLIRFDYENFSDVTVFNLTEEKPYQLDAAVVRLYLSVWF